MVTAPGMHSVFANCTNMLSTNRDALKGTNRTNIHNSCALTFFRFLVKVKVKIIILRIMHVCCICQAALANPRVQCICNIYSEFCTWQVPPSAAAITADTVFICRVADFICLQNNFGTFRTLENVSVT